MDSFSMHTCGFSKHQPKAFKQCALDAETQGGEADQAGLKTGEWEEEVLPLLPLPPSTTGEGQAVQGIDGEERRRHMAVSAAYGLVSQV